MYINFARPRMWVNTNLYHSYPYFVAICQVVRDGDVVQLAAVSRCGRRFHRPSFAIK